MSSIQAIAALKEEMEREGIRPENGLGEDLFLFSSTLMPVVNVDLLVVNEKGQVLLTWRDDPHCGTGWHIPGGCIRFGETAMERAEKTAQQEFGCGVRLEPEILHVFEIFTRHERPIKDQNERSHFVTLVLSGLAPADLDTENQTVQPGQPGFMKWFSTLPDELLQVQNCYREQWETIQRKLKGRFYDGNLEK